MTYVYVFAFGALAGGGAVALLADRFGVNLAAKALGDVEQRIKTYIDSKLK